MEPTTQTERTQKDARRWKKTFERAYGVGSWKKFCSLIWQTPRSRPGDVQAAFKSAAGNPMSKPTYYKWAARAELVQK